jgi:diaminopimelate decarboxylase
MIKLNGTMKINKEGHLEIGGIDTLDLREEFGTPLVVIDEAMVRNTCQSYYKDFVEKSDGNAMVLYASKAFITPAICQIVKQEGLGLDIVSGGELYIAMQADFPMEKVYFHGNNKTESELLMAMEQGVGRIVVDNYYEMELLNKLAKEQGKVVDILLRITPGVEAHTHEYIRTGQIDSKFGFTLPNGQAIEAVGESLKYDNLRMVGIHCHIGSQIFEMSSYKHAVEVMCSFIKDINERYEYVIEELDLGGGFGIYYTEEDTPADIQEYANNVFDTLDEVCQEIGISMPKVLIEPGRSVVGPAGTNLYTVGSIKAIPGHRKYVAVDGGMPDNIRPALYGAKYDAMIANRALDSETEIVNIAGKCCESGDMLMFDGELGIAQSGDLLAMMATGAYGYSMSSNYNSLTRPAVVLVKDGQADLIIRRESFEDLVANAIIPERIK